MNELDLNFDFNLEDFSNIEIDISFGDNNQRYICPPKSRLKSIKYRNASKLSKDISLSQNERYYCIIDGTFIFGDFIEAFIVDRDLRVKELTISTLSLSQENIDSLANLLNGGYLDKLNLIVSDYFYSHERNNLIKYAYETLDINNKFQLAVCRSHTKITLFETHCDKKVVIYGSANLRSSDNIEQFSIEHNNELYDFNYTFHKNILDNFKTINKSLRGKKLWQKVEQNQVKEEEATQSLKEEIQIKDH